MDRIYTFSLSSIQSSQRSALLPIQDITIVCSNSPALLAVLIIVISKAIHTDTYKATLGSTPTPSNANPKVSDSGAAMKFEFCMLKNTTQADF